MTKYAVDIRYEVAGPGPHGALGIYDGNDYDRRQLHRA